MVRAGALNAFLVAIPSASHAQCTPVWQDVGGVWGNAAQLAAMVNALDASSTAPSRLYVGGGFVRAGLIPAMLVASRDATGWQALGNGVDEFGAYVYGANAIDSSFGGGVGSGVVFSGIFFEPGGTSAQHIAVWSLSGWGGIGQWEWSSRSTAMVYGGPGTPCPDVYLFSGGGGTSIHGTLPYTLAHWDGERWESTGGGVAPLPPQTNAEAQALIAYDDDGMGPRLSGLYVGGSFRYAGKIEARNIARWDGSGWEPLGPGVTSMVQSLGVFDIDGSGPLHPRLFAGGQFDFAGGLKADGLGMWDGDQWSGVPGWSHGPVQTMAVFDDDGPGLNKPALFVGGLFNNTPAGLGNQIAKWDGQQWFTLGPVGQTGVTGWGMSTDVQALAVFDEDGDGPNPGGLYVGGFFTHAGGIPANSIARWGCPAPAQCYANCTLDFHPATGAHLLTVADFGCFQTKFVTQDPYADCNADGQFTVADFGCFQTKFAAGCP